MANILIKQGLEIAVPDFVITTDEARKVDLTSIIQTGTTSSQAISASTYFYLNDVLVRAKVDIANGATFTLNTNYEVVTAGALNELNDVIENVNGWTLAGNVTSTSLVTVTVPATAKEILAVLLNPSNVVLISQVIPRELMSSGASLKDVANTSKELYSNGSKWKVTDSTYTGKIYYRN